MNYSPSQIATLVEEKAKRSADLLWLKLELVQQGESASAPRAKEYLQHGAGRRIGVMLRALDTVFRVFPPDTTRPLSQDALVDAQMCLHAFVINLSGFFDNCAWAIAYERNIKALLANRRAVGMFNPATMKVMPVALREYLADLNKNGWYDTYLKEYRDALAHRIPLYLPPSQMSAEEGARYEELTHTMINSLSNRDLKGFARAQKEQHKIGGPCFQFLHSYAAEENPRPLQLHPQMLTDALTITEFSRAFFAHWRDGPANP